MLDTTFALLLVEYPAEELVFFANSPVSMGLWDRCLSLLCEDYGKIFVVLV